MTRARALMIAPATPALGGNGLAMRQGLFLEALARVADTTLLMLPIAGPPSVGGDLAATLGVETITVDVAGRGDTRFSLLSRIAAFDERLQAFRDYGRGSRHAYLSLPVLADIRTLLADKTFDLVHAGRLYVAEAAAALDAVRTLDLDEDDAWAWRRQAEVQGAAGESDRARWSLAEAEAESRLLDRMRGAFDTMFVAGSADRDGLAARHPGLNPGIVPNAVVFPPEGMSGDDGRTLLFAGTLTYPPNIEGLRWFGRKVLPRLPDDVQLRVVGRGMPQALAALRAHRQVDWVGEVADIATAYAGATLAIAPLHAGGGTRIKLIEAAAHRVPFVSTSIGAQGLDLPDEMYWRADTPDAFAAAVTEALGDPGERRNRSERAREHLRPIHDRDNVVETLACRFAAILDKSAATQS